MSASLAWWQNYIILFLCLWARTNELIQTENEISDIHIHLDSNGKHGRIQTWSSNPFSWDNCQSKLTQISAPTTYVQRSQYQLFTRSKWGLFHVHLLAVKGTPYAKGHNTHCPSICLCQCDLSDMENDNVCTCCVAPTAKMQWHPLCCYLPMPVD